MDSRIQSAGATMNWRTLYTVPNLMLFYWLE